MKNPESPAARRFLSRRRPRPAPKPGGSGHARLDVILPPGWPQSHEPVVWRWQRGKDKSQSGEAADLTQIPAAVRSAPTHVWTPATDTVLTTARLPTRARRKILQALPYLLEDRLLGDPETLHFAYRHEADGSLSVAVTARERLDAWLQAFSQAGIRPVSLCPVTLLVPWVLDCWSLSFSGNEMLVRTGAVSGFICSQSLEQPPPLLLSAIQEATHQAGQAPENLVVFNAPRSFPADAWSAILKLPVRVEPGSLWDKQGDPVAPINLLQGKYGQTGTTLTAWRPFLPALIMLAIWLLGNTVVDTADWWRLRRQHAASVREMTDILLGSFPETKTVLDPPAQMQRSADALLSHGGKDEFLSLLAKTSGALRAAPGRLRGVRYMDRSLTVEITWPTPTAPDAFRQALEAAGIHAEVLSLTPRAGEVDGRIRLQSASTATPRPGS
jgi:general secretion pathway protein L